MIPHSLSFPEDIVPPLRFDFHRYQLGRTIRSVMRGGDEKTRAEENKRKKLVQTEIPYKKQS
jgi:hypothetical protein